MGSAAISRLASLLTGVKTTNPFWRHKLAAVNPSEIVSFEDLQRLPFVTKAELVEDQARNPPYGTNRTFEIERYSRLHQTSGTTTGRPLRWLDTPESWAWLITGWGTSFPMMGINHKDRLFFPFSFGPFIGFWSAFEAATKAGFFCLCGGGMTSTARLRFLLEHEATVLFATPTYALHLAEVAQKEGIDLRQTPIRAVVVAGEPGGNIPATRDRIQEVWGARVFDHYGMTEIGPIAFEAVEDPTGLAVFEPEMIVEIINPNTDAPTPTGEVGELVVTNLGRTACPMVRYRTGDLVKVDPMKPTGSKGWQRLAGGVLGRSDDMIYMRGNNVYPGAIEAIVRRFAEVAEFRIVVDQREHLADLCVEVEPTPQANGSALADEVARALRDELLFRAEVVAVPPGALPRYELKARRLVKKA